VTATCTVNGREHALTPDETVAVLLDRLGLAGPYALVERNGEPVARSAYPETKLESGDTIVVARPAAGG
jgi:thiamine biosynthesis protein ThiS